VSKLNARGSAVVYSTYLGGEGSSDGGFEIAVDGSGMAYVTGLTCCAADFPTTPGAFDTTLNSGDAFVSKLSTTGSALVYSTFLGGTGVDIGWGIAVRGGRAYVTGIADRADFPTTPGAFDTTFDSAEGNVQDAFVTKLPTGCEPRSGHRCASKKGGRPHRGDLLPLVGEHSTTMIGRDRTTVPAATPDTLPGTATTSP
jgi:hypothetical protein